jgi:ABC-2 type transport system ATP-binding protein
VNKTSGQVNVFGYDLEKDVVNAKRQLGLVPQEFNFNPFETVQQIVVNQAGYYGVERKEAIPQRKVLKTARSVGKTQRTRADALRRDEAPPDDRPRVDA